MATAEMERTLEQELITMAHMGLIVPAIHPDGKIGWMPAPCPLCEGVGYPLVNGSVDVCPYCLGTGIEETDVQ